MIREGSIHIPFTYAAGQTGSRFLCALRDNQHILGTKCPRCTRVYCPARACCPRCGGDQLEWVPVGPAGEVVATTQLPGKGAFALVRLDGADTAMLHRLLGDAAHCAPGTRVAARFALERTGNINDLQGFIPKGGAA